MASTAQRRLARDLKRLQKDASDDKGYAACPNANNILEWEAYIFGPRDTIWEGAVLKLSMKFTEEYPKTPPMVKFLTRVYHPNVYNDGRICIDILDRQWTPIYDVCSILTSLQSLLTDPNPASPANTEAATLFRTDRDAYDRKVKECVERSLLECTDLEEE